MDSSGWWVIIGEAVILVERGHCNTGPNLHSSAADNSSLSQVLHKSYIPRSQGKSNNFQFQSTTLTYTNNLHESSCHLWDKFYNEIHFRRHRRYTCAFRPTLCRWSVTEYARTQRKSNKRLHNYHQLKEKGQGGQRRSTVNNQTKP